MSKLIAKVAVNSKAYKTDRFFDYGIPENLDIKPGMRVTVPFGGRKLEGFVAGVSENTDVENLKDIDSAPDGYPVCGEDEIALAMWIRNRWFCRYYDAFRLFMPPGCSIRFSEEVKVCCDDEVLTDGTKDSSVQADVAKFLLHIYKKMFRFSPISPPYYIQQFLFT